MQYRSMVVVAVAATQALLRPAWADETADEISSLKKQIEALDQKVKILERKQELEQDATAEKAKTAPLVSAGASGFSLTSSCSKCF